MLFFFEAGFFVLTLVALALAEFVSRGVALAFWGLLTVLALVARGTVRAWLAAREAADRTEVQWRQTVDDSWRHLNRLMLLGLVVLAGWWWLGSALGG